MKTHAAEKIRIYPTVFQEEKLKQAVGASRFAYNWALEMWQTLRRDGQKPNVKMLNKGLNEIKGEYFPWMYESPKRVVQEAILNLGVAFDRFFKGLGKYPRFKKKTGKQSARIDNGPGTFYIKDTKIRLSKIGFVKMAKPMRRSGRLLSTTVSYEGRRWFVAICLETEIKPTICENQAVIGVDLGLRHAAVLSSGKFFDNPRPLGKKLRLLRKRQRQHSKKTKGSNNQIKSAGRLSVLHWRIANTRRDFAHRLSDYITGNFSTIVLENLNVRGMLKNEKLARAIHDIGFGEIRRQVEYKAKWRNKQVIVADRFFPSSKLCSKCGSIKEDLTLSDRNYTCDCGLSIDRDLNAALNLKKYGELHRNLAKA